MVFASLIGLIYPETAQRNDRVLNDIELDRRAGNASRVASGANFAARGERSGIGLVNPLPHSVRSKSRHNA